jgi:signal transduction histidine kinase
VAAPEEESVHHESTAAGAMLRDRRGTLTGAWSRSVGLVPLALVVLALVGSVIVPARQTWSITTLLRETTELLAPARLLVTELQSGLGEEMGALQGYGLSGDTTLLVRYRLLASGNDEKLTKLKRLTVNLDTAFAGHLSVAGQRIDDWRYFSAALVEGRRVPLEVGGAVRAAQGRYDACLAAMAALSSDLSAQAVARDDRVRGLEHFSLTSNVLLVLVALAALTAVLILTLRERRLAVLLRRRVAAESTRARQEGALREAAEALAGAFTVEEVTQRIANAALHVLEGRGAFVERMDTRHSQSSNLITVGAVAGTGVPPLGSSCEFAGSYVERVLENGSPGLIPEAGEPRCGGMLTTVNGATGFAIAVPLVSRSAPVGALFILSARHHFRADDVARAAIFAHLATLAYEKVRLLDEAIEGRQRLERVISSRSRLIRGFSHDVKNPIGAADGYAELLTDGVYGDLNPQQRESVSRMRRCIHGALSLIEDLHELGRAETGHLALTPEPVNVADLVRGISEEYQAAVNASGLTFTVDIAVDLMIVQTNWTRVRQIVANLLSNAIKYTDAGCVKIRCANRSIGPTGEIGDWVIVEVSDTGRGIPQEKQDFIFEEFTRIGGGDKSGAGLGLAISRLLAQALGGQISVASELGRGSIFTLWLPTMFHHHKE